MRILHFRLQHRPIVAANGFGANSPASCRPCAKRCHQPHRRITNGGLLKWTSTIPDLLWNATI